MRSVGLFPMIFLVSIMVSCVDAHCIRAGRPTALRQ